MPIVINRIEPRRCAVIVVDMQNDFIARGAPMETPMGRELLPRLQSLLAHARATDMRVIFTAHTHRRDGSDMGVNGDIWPAIAERTGLVDGEPGAEIVPDLAPRDDDIVIKKHRYSGFYGTDLDMILRTEKIDTVAITGVTTETCCAATARDAMYNGYRVAFISDATGTYDFPDIGFGAIPAAELHRVTLGVLGFTTAHVLGTDEFIRRSSLDEPRQRSAAE